LTFIAVTPTTLPPLTFIAVTPTQPPVIL